jgi:hypothetical protein
MFAWSQRWFLSPTPFDCAYAPLFLVSGPVVHTIAHATQHWADRVLFPSAPLWIRWNIVPGTICLVLGGLQWWLLEFACVKIKMKIGAEDGSNNTSELTSGGRADAAPGGSST